MFTKTSTASITGNGGSLKKVMPNKKSHLAFIRWFWCKMVRTFAVSRRKRLCSSRKFDIFSHLSTFDALFAHFANASSLMNRFRVRLKNVASSIFFSESVLLGSLNRITVFK